MYGTINNLHFENLCFLYITHEQIDAAVNSGNSGGPAFNDKGKCVGIAFQSLKHEDAENIGYVIPTPVIKHFIEDYEKSGEYTGIFLFCFCIQSIFLRHASMVCVMGQKPMRVCFHRNIFFLSMRWHVIMFARTDVILNMKL